MLTGKTQVSNVNSFYDRDLLFRATPFLTHTKWAQTKDIPAGTGDVIKFRRYTNLSAATTPLTEGITPAGSQLAKTDISATVQQYGDFIILTDKLTMETEDPIRLETNELLGDQAGDTLDQLTRDILVGGTNIIYAGSGNVQRTDVASGDVITTAHIDAAEELLKANKTRYITSFVDASTGISTTPLAPCFIALIHVYTSKTVRLFTGFIPVEKYSQSTDRMDGEIGKYGSVRFIETVNAKVFIGGGTSSVDVYATLVFGKYAYATSRINGHALENIVKPIGSGGTSDPLNQRETSGWKATFVAKILNDDFLVRIEHTRS